MQQGGWYNTDNPPTTNGSNFETGDSTNTIAIEEGQTLGTFMNKINNESSAGANMDLNGGSNIKTVSSEILPRV